MLLKKDFEGDLRAPAIRLLRAGGTEPTFSTASTHNRHSGGPTLIHPNPSSDKHLRFVLMVTVASGNLSRWLLRVARSEDEMEKPSRGNGQTSAKISGIVHVASAEEATKFLYIRGDKPAPIVGQINRCPYMLDGEDVFERDGRPYLKLLRDRNLIN